MTDKKKGEFDQWQRKDIGGDKKAPPRGEQHSRTGGKQNQGHRRHALTPGPPRFGGTGGSGVAVL